MTPEEIWRRKSDDEVVVALKQLDEYTPKGQQVIQSEAVSRGIAYTPTVRATSARRTTIAGQESAAPPSEAKPEPDFLLMVVTAGWAFAVIAFGVALPRVDRKIAEQFGLEIDPVVTILSCLLLGMKLLKEWLDYFKAKVEWERRQNAPIGTGPTSTSHK